MRKVLLITVLSGLFCNSFVYAVDPDEVHSNLNDLSSQIKQLNQDLNNKEQQKQKIDAALKDSQGAIVKSEQLLRKLRAQRNLDQQELNDLMVKIPELTALTNTTKENVSLTITKIYQQIRQTQNADNSVFAGNSNLDQERKRIYLTEILKLEQQKYNKLDQELSTLQDLNSKLQREIMRLDAELGETTENHQKLIQVKQQNLQQASNVQKQILKERHQLTNLKQRQAQLNKLLQQLALAEKRQKALAAKKAAEAQAKAKVKTNSDNRLSTNQTNSKPSPTVDNSYEDNSPFLSRKLARPVEGKISVGFGQMRDSVRNNGVLLSVNDNTPVYAISNGSVLFSGELPGFGQIIVIDHGDNYTSVYSGILSKVAKGAYISAGSQIATSGNNSNQPMGGVYFELRHLGKPVNPTKLFN